MNEQQIQEDLKQNIPEPEPFTPAPVAPPDTSNGQAAPATTFDLDELTQYKLHDLFGQQYRPNDEVTRQQLSYIYKEVSGLVERPEYGYISAKINDLMRMIGISHSDNKMERLYQWLKLDNVRKNVEGEMWSLSGD